MNLGIRRPGLVDYQQTLDEMVQFTSTRNEQTGDELWLLQHQPVFTLGMNADPAHVLSPGGIPVVKVDRGGQVTYHGPGQLMAYVLLDMQRRRLGVRALVTLLENAVIATLGRYGISAASQPKAPGVYVDGQKIASLGLRIRRGCSYHGLALNVNMDLEPFARINPCGFPDIRVTQVATLGGPDEVEEVSADLEAELRALLG